VVQLTEALRYKPAGSRFDNLSHGEVPGGTTVNAPMDFSLKQTAMPGRISPQPAAPHHGPQRTYTSWLSPAQDEQTRSLYSLTHKAPQSM